MCMIVIEIIYNQKALKKKAQFSKCLEIVDFSV